MAEEYVDADPAETLRRRLDARGDAKWGVVQFRPGPLGYQLSARGQTLGGVAKRDLERYYQLLRTCLGEVRAMLNFWEASIVVPALRHRKFDFGTVRFIWAFVDDAVEQRKDLYIRKYLREAKQDGHPVDVPALVQKLRSLNECQAFAIYDAVGRYYRLLESRDADHTKALGQSGLWDDPADDLSFDL